MEISVFYSEGSDARAETTADIQTSATARERLLDHFGLAPANGKCKRIRPRSQPPGIRSIELF